MIKQLYLNQSELHNNPLILDIMKRINSKLAMALLRGTVALSCIMATIITALFTESLNSCVLVLLVGAIAITLIDESIKWKL